jgi:hypothetical protein
MPAGQMSVPLEPQDKSVQHRKSRANNPPRRIRVRPVVQIEVTQRAEVPRGAAARSVCCGVFNPCVFGVIVASAFVEVQEDIRNG